MTPPRPMEAATPIPGGERLLQRMFTRLGCRGRPPHFVAEFYPYSNLTHTARLAKDFTRVRLSDVLRHAPREVVEAAAALLLARAYRLPPPPELRERYQRFCHAPETQRRLERIRKRRCRPALPQADRFDLAAMFARLNRRYFGASLRRPRLAWSLRAWRVQMGQYDPALDRIVLSRRLDRPDVPRAVVEYVLYHEMLHVKHPGKFARCGFRVHSGEFREEEKHFARYEEARRWLKRLR